ncbi:MAG: nucleotidyltransferase domain-containing protein [Erysipelotrichaceae bacterium]
MRDVIIDKLREIEAREKVRILFAVESGSRAWGFASPDSDYDVRFVYVRRKEEYLRLDKTRDVIEWQLDDVLDINGWDISKALKLLHSSNCALFDWLYSPVVYMTSKEHELLGSISLDYFDVKRCVFYYLGLARTVYSNYLKSDEVKLKKYFYGIRAILAARWAIENKTVPPVEFDKLVKEKLREEDVLEQVNVIWDKKINSPELGTGSRIDILNEFIENEMDKLKDEAELLENKYLSWDKLNSFFMEVVFNLSASKEI